MWQPPPYALILRQPATLHPKRVPRRQQPAAAPAPPEAALPCRADWRVARLFSRRLALEGAWRCWKARAAKQVRRWPPHQTYGPTPLLRSVAATSAPDNGGDDLSDRQTDRQRNARPKPQTDLRDDRHQTVPALSPAPMTVRSSGGPSWTLPSCDGKRAVDASPSGPRSNGGGCGSS
eukprot:scaffold100876_cov63-Phaeocystis_antarctica.AAC.1